MQDLAQADRPRERLWRLGPRALADAELLAVVIGSGSETESALQLAQRLLGDAGGIHALARWGADHLRRVHGIGPAKAASIAACLELGRRAAAVGCPGTRVHTAAQAAEYVMPSMAHLQQEELRVMSLDTKGHVLAVDTVFVGDAAGAPATPREIYRQAILRGAARVILLHNHPSGDPVPSPEDLETTRRLAAGGALVGIPLMDHVVIGDGRYVSIKALGKSSL